MWRSDSMTSPGSASGWSSSSSPNGWEMRVVTKTPDPEARTRQASRYRGKSEHHPGQEPRIQDRAGRDEVTGDPDERIRQPALFKPPDRPVEEPGRKHTIPHQPLHDP